MCPLLLNFHDSVKAASELSSVDTTVATSYAEGDLPWEGATRKVLLPPKTNISPKNPWLEDENSFWNGPLFGDMLIFDMKIHMSRHLILDTQSVNQWFATSPLCIWQLFLTAFCYILMTWAIFSCFFPFFNNHNQRTNEPTNQRTNEPTNQRTSQPASQPANQPTDQPTNPPTNQPTNQTTKQPNNQTTKQPNNQTTKQPNNQTTKQQQQQQQLWLSQESSYGSHFGSSWSRVTSEKSQISHRRDEMWQWCGGD